LIKIGFIGVGFVAQQCHLPSFDSTPGCEIYAVSDLQKDLADKISRRYEVEKTYYSHQELLNDPEIDAVVITVPRPLTNGLCIEALKSNKKVFTEKPISLNKESANQIITLSQELNVPVQVGYMRRYDLAVQKTLELINDLKKENKNPLLIRSYCYMGDSYASPFGDFKSNQDIQVPVSNVDKFPTWLDSKKYKAYENYVNTFSHTIDTISYLINEKIKHQYSSLDEVAQGITVFKSEQNIPIEFSTAKSNLNQWMEGISFVYDDLIIDLTLTPAFIKNVPGKVSIRSGQFFDNTQEIRPQWSWSFKNQAANFIELCNNWPNYNSNLNDAVNHISMIENIFKD